jgi:aspartate/methionine/tyrosine aminotransferase
MSKVAALPQMKVAWLAGFGPEEVLREALGRLEVIADTFLSMSAPVQLALPRWLEDRAGMQGQIRRRVEENLASVREAGLEMLRVEAGWAAVLWLRGAGAADVAMALLERAGVIVHPGAFYGLQDRRMVVVSLLTAVEVFRVGLHRIAGFDWGS